MLVYQSEVLKVSYLYSNNICVVYLKICLRLLDSLKLFLYLNLIKYLIQIYRKFNMYKIIDRFILHCI